MKSNYLDLIAKFYDTHPHEEPWIFLSGGMSGLTIEERTKWRKELINDLGNNCYVIDPTIFDPEKEDDSYQKEAYEYCLWGVINCDYFVINLTNQMSVGSAQEIMLAWLMDKPILCIKPDDGKALHYWYKNKITHFFRNVTALSLWLRLVLIKGELDG